MIYIVVLNWNGWRDTLACLQSLKGLDYSGAVKVLVCDNASTDESVPKVREWIAATPASSSMSFELVNTGGNLGYAGGNNVGLKLALQDPRMRYCWVLNNDTELHPGALKHLVERMDADPRRGICGSRLVFFSDRSRVQALGGLYNSWTGRTGHYGEGMDAAAQYDDDDVEKQIDYVVGASMLVSRAFIEAKGLMSEDYFLYYEELDWAYRASPEFKCAVATASIVYHKVGASISGKARESKTSMYYSLKSRLAFSRRFHPLKSLVVRSTYLYSVLRRVLLGRYADSLLMLKIMLSLPTARPPGVPGPPTRTSDHASTK